MNIYSATKSEMLAQYNQGFRWVVLAKYEHKGHPKGEIISWHKSQEDALAAETEGNAYTTTRELDDLISDAIDV